MSATVAPAMNAAAAAASASGSLYVGDLHPDVPEALLYEMFNYCGPVASVRVCRDVQTRRSLGYAYVNFHNVEDAQRALDTMNFRPINGKVCRIMWSQRDPLLRKSGVGNIFVKNLAKTIDNQTLNDTFSVFGTIMSCKVITNKMGESLGYGFVHFSSDEEAALAIQTTNGNSIGGQVVQVVAFKSKKERGASDNAKFTNVYIKNIPTEWKEDKVKEVVAEFGTATSIFFPTEEKKKGFVFVNFSTHEQAQACLEKLNGTAVEGTDKVLYVSKAQKKDDREKELKSRYDNFKNEQNNKANLYVKNLADDIDDERLRGLFASYGAITSARVMVDPKTKKSLGFGFVCFSNPDEANNAMMKLNGSLIDGKPLYVNLAQRKDQRRKHLEKIHNNMKMGANIPQSQMYSTSGPMFYSARPGPPMYFPQQMMGQRMYPQQPQILPGAVGSAQYSLLPVPTQNRTGAGQMRAGRAGRPQRPQGQQQPGGPGPKPVAGQQGVPQNPAQIAAAQAQQRAMQQTAGARGPNFQNQQNLRFESNVRNMSQPGQQQARPVAEVASVSSTQPLIKALAAADDKQKKRLIGERLFPLIAQRQPVLAGKITGMLLEIDDGELINLLESEVALEEKIEEALKVLSDEAEANKAE